MKEEFDFESIKNKTIEQLKAGKPLLGKDGAFAPLLESILNAALEGEMDAHLTEEERQMGNRRNGKMQKQVQTSLGEVTVSTPRDRNSSFDPQFIKKRETILAEGVADRIIGCMLLVTAHVRLVIGWKRILGIVYLPIQSVLLLTVYFRK